MIIDGLILCSILIFIGIYIIFRIRWVHDHLIESFYQDDYKLPSDNVMMCNFWVWDIEKFKIRSNDE